MKGLNSNAKLIIFLVPYLFIIRMLLKLPAVSNFINNVEAYSILFSILLGALLVVFIIMGINEIIKRVYSAEELEKRTLKKEEKKRFIVGVVIFAIAVMFITGIPPISYIFQYSYGTPLQHIANFFKYLAVAAFGTWYTSIIIRERELN